MAAVTVELPCVHHHLHALLSVEKGVVEVPVRVCSPAQDVLAVLFIICTHHTNTGKKRLHHANQIICLVGCKEGVHSRIPPSHVDRKNKSY